MVRSRRSLYRSACWSGGRMRIHPAFLAAFVFRAALALGQTVSGQISGTVFDASGAVVPGADVTVRSRGTGVTQKRVTNESGYYVATDLLPGTYEVSVEMAGFRRSVQSVTLNANSKITVNVTLTPGASSEVVELSAEKIAPLAGRYQTSGDEAFRLEARGNRLFGKPTLGEEYELFAIVDYTSSFNSMTAVADQHVNGLRGNTTGLMVDGSYNLDVGSNGTNLVNPSIDSIQEVKVSTNSYSAEYGHAQGAQVNIVTRSGTRTLHGAAFEFLRNDHLDSNDWISNRSALGKRPLRFHDYGANLGGPLFLPGRWNTEKTKAFFFFSIAYRHNTLGTTRTGNVPTAEERQGDFRNSTLAVPLDYRTRQPLNPDNPRVLPASLFSPTGLALLRPYPLPNTSGPGFNYILQTIASNPQQEQLLRVDYNFSNRTQVFFRWIRDLFDSADQGNGSALGIVGNTNRRNGTQIALNVSHTLHPHAVNVFNFSLSGNRINNFPITTNFTRDGLGLGYPKLFGSNRYNAGPDVSIQGFTGYGIGANLQNFQWLFVWRDDLTWVRGNHALKFGVWLERFRKNANVLQSGPRDNGAVNFATSSALSSGNPVGSSSRATPRSRLTRLTTGASGRASPWSTEPATRSHRRSTARSTTSSPSGRISTIRPSGRNSTRTGACGPAPATSSANSTSTALLFPATAGPRAPGVASRRRPTPHSTGSSAACRAASTTPGSTTSRRAFRSPGTRAGRGTGRSAAAAASPTTASATGARSLRASACPSSSARRSLTRISNSPRRGAPGRSSPRP
ncbi:MAG: hypothetical protein DMG07_27800 [Acidobacteria bacterium]|nr:MAG: hypothetical protein DMG07_27800 [Acidobacteriota bacterium]